MNTIIALDISLSSTGVAIFSEDGKIVKLLTVETKGDMDTPMRLSKIAKKMKEILSFYKPKTVVIEQGFTRFNTSTQQLFRVHGVVNYIFCKVEQIYYYPASIRKIVFGKGNLKKEEVQKLILENYGDIKFSTLDESDAYCTGLAYFKEKGIIQ